MLSVVTLDSYGRESRPMKSRKTMYEMILAEALRRPPIKLRDGRIGYGLYRDDVKKLFTGEGFKPKCVDNWLSEWRGNNMILSGESPAGSLAYLFPNLITTVRESLDTDIERFGFQESKNNPENLDAKEYNEVVG